MTKPNLVWCSMSVVLFAGSAFAVSAAPAPKGPCDAEAIAILKAIIRQSDGEFPADEQPEYSVTESKIADDGKTQVLSARAFGLSGEDSDTLKTYEMTFSLWSSGQKCSKLEKLELTEEN